MKLTDAFWFDLTERAANRVRRYEKEGYEIEILEQERDRIAMSMINFIEVFQGDFTYGPILASEEIVPYPVAQV